MNNTRHKLNFEAKGVKMRLDIPDDKLIRFSVAWAITAFGILMTAIGIATILFAYS